MFDPNDTLAIVRALLGPEPSPIEHAVAERLTALTQLYASEARRPCRTVSLALPAPCTALDDIVYRLFVDQLAAATGRRPVVTWGEAVRIIARR